MFTVAVGAAVQALLVALAVRGVGSCWIGSTIFAANLVRDELGSTRRLGTVGRHRHWLCRAACRRASRSGAGQRPAGAQVSVRSTAIEVLSDWQAPDRWQDSVRHAVLAFLDARDDACRRECVPGHITASALVLDHTGGQVLLTLHPRLGRWVQLGGHCEEYDDDIFAAALREATEESGVDRSADLARPGRGPRPRADLLAGRTDPPPRLAVRGPRAGRSADLSSATSQWTCGGGPSTRYPPNSDDALAYLVQRAHTETQRRRRTAMTATPTYLVTGAGGGVGGVGRIVVDELLASGQTVRAMVHREDDRAEALRESGAHVVVGDLTDPVAVADALDGVTRMFFSMSVSASDWKPPPLSARLPPT